MSTIQVNVYDGTRKPISPNVQLLVRAIDGYQKQVYSDFVKGPVITIPVPFYDNFGDFYTVLVHGKDFGDSGLRPVHVQQNGIVNADLMLLPNGGGFNFSSLASVQVGFPRTYGLLGAGLAATELKAKFDDARESTPLQLGALLNICTAAQTIPLPPAFKSSPLEYDWQLRWDLIYPDRFYAWVDRKLVDAVRRAADLHIFAEEKDTAAFHTGAPDGIGPATVSWKEVRFDVANVQLTFHEENTQTIAFSDGAGGQRQVQCVIVEPDIDYFKDLAAHALLEVIPNALLGGKTDPRMSYMLRWMAQRREALAEFDPPCTVQP